MDDLISRQVAIDAICTEGTRLERNGTVAMVEIKQWCVDILEALPSAQVIRCYECKYASYEPCGHVKNVYVCNRTPWTRMNGGNLSVCFCSYAEREGEDVHD